MEIEKRLTNGPDRGQLATLRLGDMTGPEAYTGVGLALTIPVIPRSGNEIHIEPNILLEKALFGVYPEIFPIEAELPFLVAC